MTDASGEPNPPDPLSEEQRTDLLNEMLARHTNILAEHFSSVQIICTKLEPDGNTRRFHKGSGDFYARLGATAAWLNEQTAAQ